MNVHGMSFRYAVTLAAQLIRLVLAGVTASIVPRTLGPLEYGNYNFLIGITTTTHNFLDPSASHAFFTFSSSRTETGSITRLFAAVLAGQLAIALTLVFAAVVGGWVGLIWPGQTLTNVVMVTIMVWLTFASTALQQLGDSKGLTVRSQLMGVLPTGLVLVGIVVLVAAGQLTVTTLAMMTAAGATIGCLLLARFLIVRHRAECWEGSLRRDGRQIVRSWWTYAAPLLAIEYCTPLTTLLSLYLVQTEYGPSEQGYLSLATRWSALVVVFTSASLMIVWRELARHTASGDLAAASDVYRQSTAGLFCVTLVLCAWLSGLSPFLVANLAGPDYLPAIPVVAIMAFYPLQQTIGQLTAAAFKATGRTVAYRNLGFIYFGIDLLLTYLLLAPPTALIPGLGLGAVGVAIRLVAFGLIGVQLYERADARYFGFSYVQALFRKLRAVILVAVVAGLTLAWGQARLVDGIDGGTVTAAAVSSVLYLCVIGTIVLRWPEAAGLSRRHVEWLFNGLRRVKGVL